jgi:hypothetical protein
MHLTNERGFHVDDKASVGSGRSLTTRGTCVLRMAMVSSFDGEPSAGLHTLVRSVQFCRSFCFCACAFSEHSIHVRRRSTPPSPLQTPRPFNDVGFGRCPPVAFIPCGTCAHDRDAWPILASHLARSPNCLTHTFFESKRAVTSSKLDFVWRFGLNQCIP